MSRGIDLKRRSSTQQFLKLFRTRLFSTKKGAPARFSSGVHLFTCLAAQLLTLICSAVCGAEVFSSQSPGGQSQVVIVQDAKATSGFRPRLDRIRSMMNRGMTNVTSKATVREAWSSLVKPEDVVGIKVVSSPGALSGTRPAVVMAVIEGLLTTGLPSNHIVIWDKQLNDLKNAGFGLVSERYGVRLAGSAQEGWDPGHDEKSRPYDTPLLGDLVWIDLEFGKKGEGVARKSFLSRLVTTQLTKIINVTPLLNHNEAGVCGNLYSLAMGSVDNTARFESDPERLATAVPDIYNLPVLAEHVVLNIVDALICQYEGGERGLLHYSSVMNQLRFSRDPIALDVLSIQELERQRPDPDNTRKSNLELYSNAALLELGVSDLKKIRIHTVP
jgi:hypothetical protein